jgi:hypothetical protein
MCYYMIRFLLSDSWKWLQGCLSDHNSLVNTMKDMDVVISTMGGREITEQLMIVDAIKEVGTVKVSALVIDD